MPDGERTNGTAATEHTADRRSRGQAEGKARKGGRREGHGWPRAWGAEEGNTAAGREQGENEKRDI